jgi:hypothetical protein
LAGYILTRTGAFGNSLRTPDKLRKFDKYNTDGLEFKPSMLSTPHLLVGAAIVHSIPNPAISLPAAFLSHFVLDATPHWDGSPEAPFSKKVVGGVIFDYIFGASLIFLITQGDPRQAIILLGAFLATLPDFIMAFSKHVKTPLIKLPLIAHFNKYHSHIQTNVRFSHGLLASFAAGVAGLMFLIK